MKLLLKKWRLNKIAEWAGRTPDSVESDIKSMVMESVNREPGISWANTVYKNKNKNIDSYIDRLTYKEIKRVYRILPTREVVAQS